jgi:hypothetical protein
MFTPVIALLFMTSYLHSSLEATHVCCVPVADIVARPGVVYRLAAPVVPYHAPEILAQLIYGEEVKVHAENGIFSEISVPAQSIMINNTLSPLRGWVLSASLVKKQRTQLHQKYIVCGVPWTAAYQAHHKKRYTYTLINALPFGTILPLIHYDGNWVRVRLPDGQHAAVPRSAVAPFPPCEQHENLRKLVIERARQFIGMPYCWGGMSPHQPAWPEKLSSFDCSGLVYRVMSSCGISVPRNSRSQYRVAQPCIPQELQAGDLVFLAHAGKKDICAAIFHVMIYTGENTLIEAWTEHHLPDYHAQPIREVSIEERLGKPLAALKQGMCCPQGYRCYFGKVITAVPK